MPPPSCREPFASDVDPIKGSAERLPASMTSNMIWPVAALAVLVLVFLIAYGSVVEHRVNAQRKP